MGKQSSAIGNQLRRQVAKIVVATVLELDANLREATPVKTGHARANWIPSIGSPNLEVGDGEHDAGVAAIVTYKLEDGPAFETNNVPYVPILNGGTSDQAPALFIEASRDKAVETMQQRFGTTITKIV